MVFYDATVWECDAAGCDVQAIVVGLGDEPPNGWVTEVEDGDYCPKHASVEG